MKTICGICLTAMFLTSCMLFRTNGDAKQNENDEGLEEVPSQQSIDTTGKTVLDGYIIDGSCKALLIELVSERRGMVLPQGRILDLRILRNGSAEYDQSQYSNNTHRMRIDIGEGQINLLNELLNSKAVLSLDNLYIEEDPCLDAEFSRIITFCPSADSQPKIIAINECRRIDSDLIKPGPPVLKELIKSVEGFKSEY